MTRRDDHDDVYEVAERLVRAALDRDVEELHRITDALCPDPRMIAARRVIRALARTVALKAQSTGSDSPGAAASRRGDDRMSHLGR